MLRRLNIFDLARLTNSLAAHVDDRNNLSGLSLYVDKVLMDFWDILKDPEMKDEN